MDDHAAANAGSYLPVMYGLPSARIELATVASLGEAVEIFGPLEIARLLSDFSTVRISLPTSPDTYA